MTASSDGTKTTSMTAAQRLRADMVAKGETAIGGLPSMRYNALRSTEVGAVHGRRWPIGRVCHALFLHHVVPSVGLPFVQ